MGTRAEHCSLAPGTATAIAAHRAAKPAANPATNPAAAPATSYTTTSLAAEPLASISTTTSMPFTSAARATPELPSHLDLDTISSTPT